MLQSLYIKDFILIEKLDLELSDGFCVITGETGAGKSILLDSILFALGGKINGSPIKPGADSCCVTLVFMNNDRVRNYLEEIDIDPGMDDIIIKCSQNLVGRKKFYINNEVVSAKVLKKLFDYLLEIHGQHNHTSLLDQSLHIDILDEFSSLEKEKQLVASSYSNWKNIKQKIKLFQQEKEKIDEEIDYLQHVCEEIKNANISENEEEELLDIKKKIQNYSGQYEAINSIIHDIEKASIEHVIARAQKNISYIENAQQAEKIDKLLEHAYDNIENAKDSMKDILYNLTLPEYSLEEIEDRLYEIRSLARKHNCSVQELQLFLNKSLDRLSSLEKKVDNSSTDEKRLQEYAAEYVKNAQALTDKRIINAGTLAKKVMRELSLLDMKKAIFKIEVTTNKNTFTASGSDNVRFIASTNPGMDMDSIVKIASGGELSRFMLSLRVALFDNAPKQTIIFDEIDVGISGSVADSIGERIKKLSKVVQIIAITHQPQVAGKAKQHILVEKKQHQDHTKVKVKELNGEEKSYEIARMISGKKITKTGLRAAKELI